MADYDRRSALLTNTQREWLDPDGDSVSKSHERNLRESLPDRIESTMADFALLFSYLDDDLLLEAFGDGLATQLDVDDEKFQTALEESDSSEEIDPEEVTEDAPKPRDTGADACFAIAFLLRGLNYGDEQVYEYVEREDMEQPAFAAFIRALEDGIRLYLRDEQNIHANVDVNIGLSDMEPTFVEEG